MLNYIIYYAFIVVFIAYIFYEFNFHKKFKNDLKKEKLIADFSYIRIQLMKMLYMHETDINSVYFKFMLKATSYSIRTLYFYNHNICDGLTKTKILTEVLPLLEKKELKEEFKYLNVEQKDLFIKVILNILDMYLENKYIEKLIFKVEVQKVKNIIYRISNKMISLLLNNNKQVQDKIKYINDINEYYNIEGYAFSY